VLLILYSIALGKVSRLNASEKLIGADLELFLFTLQYDCRFAGGKSRASLYGVRFAFERNF